MEASCSEIAAAALLHVLLFGYVKSSLPAHQAPASNAYNAAYCVLQDLTVVATLDPALWADDMGQRHTASILGISKLDDKPLNMSLLAPTNLLLRGFYTNRSSATAGQDGVQSFLDVMLIWEQGSQGQALTAGQLAGIVVAVAVAVLAGATAAVLYARRRKFSHSTCKTLDPKGGNLLPQVFADAACRYSNDKDSDCTGSPGIPAGHTASGTAENLLSQVAGSSTISSSTMMGTMRKKSGPSQDIIRACRSLVLRKTAKDADELVLESVLGEGSYGKVSQLLVDYCTGSSGIV